jgi:hypothetical protein
VWAALIDLAAWFGPREMRAVRPRLLADYGADGELQYDQDLAARRVALSQPYDHGDGTFQYGLRLDAEGMTVLEAALGPLAAPRPADGVPDRRGSDRRRADALIELVRRAVACPDGVLTAAKAQLFLTVDIEDLAARVGAATTVGSAHPGTVLAPETVRRIGCDAGLIPTVMAGPRHVLDLGHAARRFTPAQTKALWLRDRHCTIPAARCPPNGRMDTTSGTGPTAARPTSVTPPCCADTTTAGSTTTVSPPPSPPTGTSSGTSPPAPTTNNHHDPAPHLAAHTRRRGETS